MKAARSGFTLVETMFAVALFAFAVSVAGPLLARVQATTTQITASQRRTAALSGNATRLLALPYSALVVMDTTTIDNSTNYPLMIHVTISDTLGYARRIRLIVEPVDSLVRGADTVLMYRSGASPNPFDAP